MKLLLVEDDVQIAENLKVILESQAYAVSRSTTIEDGLTKIMSGEYDLLICDRRLPDGDGIEIVKAARSAGLMVATLMLTARNTKMDTIEGLDAGADDYMAKPFDSNVLLAKVRSLLRRRKKQVLKPVVRIGQIVINTNSREVRRNDKVVFLSPKEYGILQYLLANQDRIVERVEILTHVWNEEVDLFSNTVDVHIRYLRQKLGDEIITTVRGKGYKLCTTN